MGEGTSYGDAGRIYRIPPYKEGGLHKKVFGRFRDSMYGSNRYVYHIKFFNAWRYQTYIGPQSKAILNQLGLKEAYSIKSMMDQETFVSKVD